MVGSAAIKQGRSANRKHTYFYFLALFNMIMTFFHNDTAIGLDWLQSLKQFFINVSYHICL